MNKSLYDGRSRKRWKTLLEDRDAWSRITKQVNASKWGTTCSSASKRGKYAIPPINCTGHPTEIRSYLERNKSFNITGLQCDRESREHLKYLRNVYCVMNNHSKGHKLRGCLHEKARVSYRDGFLISHRVYMMTGSFHILLFEGTLRVDNTKRLMTRVIKNRKYYACATRWIALSNV